MDDKKKLTDDELDHVSGGWIEQTPDGDYLVYDEFGNLHGTFDRIDDARDFNRELNGNDSNDRFIS